MLADKGYDADRLRRAMHENGTVPVIPGRRSRKRAIRYDQERQDFRRVATRYDKLAANFLSGVALATAIAFWLRLSLSPRIPLKELGRIDRRATIRRNGFRSQRTVDSPVG